MVGFNAVHLFAKFIFQLGIGRLRAFHIFILCRVGSTQHHIAASIDQDKMCIRDRLFSALYTGTMILTFGSIGTSIKKLLLVVP